MNREFNLYELIGGQEALQTIVDTVNSKYNNTAWKSRLEWDIKQIGLTFEVLSAQSNIAPMASIIGVNDPKPLRSVDGFSSYGGSIPKLGHGYEIKEQELRDQQFLYYKSGMYDKSILFDIAFNNIDKLIQGAHSRINFQDDQMRSTGVVNITTESNPDGIPLFVNYRVPDENRLKTGFANAGKATWSDPVNSNPIQDLIDMTAYADRHDIVYDVFEMSKTLWNTFCDHPKVLDWVRRRLKVADNVTYPVGKSEVLATLDGYSLPPIVVCDSKYNSETDGFAKYVKGFDENNVILRPSGLIGKVKNAISMHTLAPSTADNARTTVEDGRIAILNQWESRKLINHIELEGYAIPTLANPKNLLILNTSEAAV